MVQFERCADRGSERLHTAIETRAIQEMNHAETLIERILCVNGSPTVSKSGSPIPTRPLISSSTRGYAPEIYKLMALLPQPTGTRRLSSMSPSHIWNPWTRHA